MKIDLSSHDEFGHASPGSPGCLAYRKPLPAPRAVPWAAPGFRVLFGLTLAAAFAAFATIFVVYAGTSPWTDLVLDERGRRTLAEPVETRPTFLSVNDRRVFDQRVRFALEDGQRHEAAFRTSDPRVVAAAEKGRPIEIEYDPENPARIRAHGATSNPLGPFAWVLYLVWLALWGLVGLCVARVRRTRRLYRNGTATEARVDAVDLSAWVSGQRLWWVHYTFATPAGDQHGRALMKHPPRPGDTIWTIYDPDQPGRNVTPS